MQTGAGVGVTWPVGVRLAGLGVFDAEDDDGAGVLVGGVEEVAGRGEIKIAGGLALGGFVAERGEGACSLRIDGEDGDAVVAAGRRRRRSFRWGGRRPARWN